MSFGHLAEYWRGGSLACNKLISLWKMGIGGIGVLAWGCVYIAMR